MPLDFTKKNSENNKSNHIEYIIQSPKYQLENIVLSNEQECGIRQVLAYMENKELLLKTWGLEKFYPESRGLFINLYGASGTGKTMAAHAIAEKLNKDVILVNYAEIESKYVGETSKNLYQIFAFAKEHDVVLVFDEADALLSKRVTNMTSSTDVSVNQTKSVLLNIMNDYDGIVIFTTNFISNYDFAFIRRIPFQIEFKLPDEQQRKKIWEYYLSAQMPYNLNLKEITEKYTSISGSDISNCVLSAALYAAMDHADIVSEKYFYTAMDNIVKAKQANKEFAPKIVSQREVSEDYALKQINGG